MTTVKLSDDLVNKAKRYAGVYSRSVPKQIEHWAKIGRIVEQNPDLPYPFVMEILEAMEETETTPFVFSTRAKSVPKKKKK